MATALLDQTTTMSELSQSKESGPSLLQRIAAGDHQAVELCLDQYGALVWSIAKRLSISNSDAEDATQEIFVEIWKKASSYDPTKSAESTFVSMIARRRLIDRLRSNKQHEQTISMSAETVEVPDEIQVSAPEIADEAQKALRCVQKLSKEQQKVIMLSVQVGLSHRLISEKLKMPLGTVKSFARRALIALRDCMARTSVPSVERGLS
ncbi:MAG: RNA polymerase sigma factor [Aureliella sp.]